MTQFEYVVWQFIENHPRCTKADILSSFQRKPDLPELSDALETLSYYDLIMKVQSQADPSEKPLRSHYYYPSQLTA